VDDFAVIMPDFLAMNENFTFDIALNKSFLYSVKMTGIRLEKFEIGKRDIVILPG
jgi:hypothetical protein